MLSGPAPACGQVKHGMNAGFTPLASDPTLNLRIHAIQPQLFNIDAEHAICHADSSRRSRWLQNS
jgi:hypothetical protein